MTERNEATGEGRENCRVITPRRVPLIYIAGPYRPTKKQRERRPYDENNTWLTKEAWERHHADNHIGDNIEGAHEAGRMVVQAGGMPLTPHKCTEHMDGLIADDEFIARDLGTYLPVCDALWAIEGWRESAGAIAEVHEAMVMSKPVIFSVSQMRDYIAYAIENGKTLPMSIVDNQRALEGSNGSGPVLAPGALTDSDSATSASSVVNADSGAESEGA
jgi:hypothetical protein